MKENIKPSILVSIFNRKGHEGQFTKIFNESTVIDYPFLKNILKADEKGIIIYYRNESNWFFLSDKNIAAATNGIQISIPIFNLIKVSPSLSAEFKAGNTNKNQFTKLSLYDKSGSEYLVELEMGGPYYGIYQVLHFLTT